MKTVNDKRSMMKKASLFLIAPMVATTLNASSIFFDQGFDNDFRQFNQLAQAMLNSHRDRSSFGQMGFPHLNMSENEKNYTLKFELPGMDKSEVKLSLEQDRVLTIEGEKRRESKENNKTFVREEISYGKFKRVLRLPKDADSDKMTTSYKDGILTVVIPKKEIKKSPTKIIPIN